jgi:hypothetical protein
MFRTPTSGPLRMMRFVHDPQIDSSTALRPPA